MPDLASQLPQQLPLFFRLKPAEMKLFMKICKHTTCDSGELLCEYGTASRRFFILLEGELEVIGKDGTVLARMRPVTTVGEMGFINKKPRSATVRAVVPSQLLKIEHYDFELLLDTDSGFRSRMYRNMIRVLSDKLSDANDRLMRYKKLCEASGESKEVRLVDVGDGEPEAAAAIALPAGEEQDAGDGSEESRAGAAPVHELIHTFYELLDQTVDSGQLVRDGEELADLRERYSEAEIEYAVKWTAEEIPAAKLFKMVRLSIEDALVERKHLDRPAGQC